MRIKNPYIHAIRIANTNEQQFTAIGSGLNVANPNGHSCNCPILRFMLSCNAEFFDV